MATISSSQQISALRFPWHARRGRSSKMARVDTPCSGSPTSRVTSPVDKENLRKQIVGLALKQEKTTNVPPEKHSTSTDNQKRERITSLGENIITVPFLSFNPVKANKLDSIIKENSPRQFTRHRHLLVDLDSKESKMSRVATHTPAQHGIVRSKTPVQIDRQMKPKIVRFRMDEYTIGKQKTPIVNITDTNGDSNEQHDAYEVRGSAINMRREGLKGVLAYKDICEENEKRQNSLQTSLKIFRRRIKLNQEKFIQPNETTMEDYVIHRRSPFCDINTAPLAHEDGPASRPMSSDDHVRILRSALQNKHNGGNTVVKQTDTQETGESYKNIKCSYRLPENMNWGKEVSFKDIKDDTIPNVKTYVLAQEAHPHAKFKKNNIPNSVTLNSHNLSVHNSITHVNGHKMKVGDTEVAFDPRFLDWLEDSLTNVKLHKTKTMLSDDILDCPTPIIKRRMAAKT